MLSWRSVRGAMRRVGAPFRSYRSGGYVVSERASRLIQEGNAHRLAKDWAGAARAYRAALDLESELAHIWVQCGHALKEIERWASAEQAYRTARSLLRDNLDTGFQFGRFLHDRHRSMEALEPLLETMRVHPQADEVARLLEKVIAVAIVADRHRVMRQLRAYVPASPPADSFLFQLRTAIDEVDRTEASMPPVAGIVYDASDLIAYFSDARLPTGIQRVQLEIIQAAIQLNRAAIRVCCFSPERDSWIEIPIAQFETIAALSVKGGDRADGVWTAALSRLRCTLALAPPFQFVENDILVNLGTSWWLQNYFLYVREAKRRWKIRYVPFVHDIIPIRHPEYCIRELTQDFISWIIGIFNHADHFLVNSMATSYDLLETAKTLGVPLSMDRMTIVRLDAAFGSDIVKHGDGKPALFKTGGSFVLFVSTIEARKGHAFAFDAWLKLVAAHGDKMPSLICVGSRGWLNDHVYTRLEDPALNGKIEIRSHVSDTDLRQLYDNCLFTLYPSLYEGWGLPVTESLVHGKVPLISTSSSLPEAGGEFAVYVTPGQAEELAAAVERLVFDEEFRHGLERCIVEKFRPRRWTDLATQIKERLIGGPESGKAVLLLDRIELPRPLVKSGLWYSLGRSRALQIWRGIGTGDIFRDGLGWRGPEDWGCRTQGVAGGRLRFDFVEAFTAPTRLFIGLRAAMDQETLAIVSIERGPTAVTTLPANEFGWITLDISPMCGNDVVVTVRGELSESAPRDMEFLEDRSLPVAVTGFAFARGDDILQRQTLIEAMVLNYLDPINPFAEKPSSRIAGLHARIEAQKAAQESFKLP